MKKQETTHDYWDFIEITNDFFNLPCFILDGRYIHLTYPVLPKLTDEEWTEIWKMTIFAYKTFHQEKYIMWRFKIRNRDTGIEHNVLAFFQKHRYDDLSEFLCDLPEFANCDVEPMFSNGPELDAKIKSAFAEFELCQMSKEKMHQFLYQKCEWFRKKMDDKYEIAASLCSEVGLHIPHRFNPTYKRLLN